MTIEQAIQINCEASCSDKEAEAHEVLVTKLREQESRIKELDDVRRSQEAIISSLQAIMDKLVDEVEQLRNTTDEQEAALQLADELVEHILTSESRNPELGAARAYREVREKV